MIPVEQKPAPKGFNEKVYQPGRKWLKEHGHPLRGAIPKDAHGNPAFELPPYWRACLDDLHRLYDGVCAYICIYIDIKQSNNRRAHNFVELPDNFNSDYELKFVKLELNFFFRFHCYHNLFLLYLFFDFPRHLGY